MVAPLQVTFVGGSSGPWRVERIQPVVGASLPPVTHLTIVEDRQSALSTPGVWHLAGVTSHQRYTTRHEQGRLATNQPALARPHATRAALIPITKSPAWWELTQDERRAIFEEGSRHIEQGLGVLPAIARRLHHGRDLGEPFDFLTWFEYAPSDTAAFEDLVAALRMTEEWAYVEREIDIRLAR